LARDRERYGKKAADKTDVLQSAEQRDPDWRHLVQPVGIVFRTLQLDRLRIKREENSSNLRPGNVAADEKISSFLTPGSLARDILPSQHYHHEARHDQSKRHVPQYARVSFRT